MKSLFLLLSLTISFNSFSYTISNIKNKTHDPTKPTHVIVIGEGKELQTLFLEAGLTKLLKINDVHPTHNTIVIWAQEYNQARDAKYLIDRGYTILESNGRKLTNTILNNLLIKFENVLSFHMFSHSGAFFGSLTNSGGDGRFGYKSKGTKKLKKIFHPDAYAFLYGCNSGFIEAPELSKLWNIPVYGSLTTTDFQRLHNNNRFYHNNKGQYPSGGWNKTNYLSLNNPTSCYKGSCLRMKPDAFPYTGMHGSYKIGLPFYKLFCNLEEGNHYSKRCQNAFYNQITTFTSIVNQDQYSSRSIYKKAVLDFLCPGDNNTKSKSRCLNTLNYADSNKRISLVNLFNWGVSADCDLSTCHYKYGKVKNRKGQLVNSFEPTGEEKGSAAVTEFLYYMSAFDQR